MGQVAVAAVLRQPLELQHVDREGARLQGDALAFGVDHRRAVLRQAVAQRRKRLAQGALGLAFAPVAPQERSQLFARPRLARRQRQIGEQSLGLAARERYRRVRPVRCLETAQQPHVVAVDPVDQILGKRLRVGVPIALGISVEDPLE